MWLQALALLYVPRKGFREPNALQKSAGSQGDRWMHFRAVPVTV